MNDIALVTVLRSIIGGFSDNELIEIRLTTEKNTNFYNSMKQYKEKQDLKDKIQNFLNKIENLKKEQEYMPLDEFIWKIYLDTGYYNYVSLMPNGMLRAQNLKMLFERAKQYEKTSYKGLYNFISFIEKLSLSSGDMSSAKLIGENENVIRIMSIHKSKGLEFPVVFLCNTSKRFNKTDIYQDVILIHQDIGLRSEIHKLRNRRKIHKHIKRSNKNKTRTRTSIRRNESTIRCPYKSKRKTNNNRNRKRLSKRNNRKRGSNRPV